ncbi:hypothetical protein ABMA32_20280 [Mesorhizobium sp. VNQ89]|uniref:hypothetical protein n=1 Tax=Mesorhizobium quangtriensis TaxID=3157709 RepID=UPI0032B7E4EE
MSNIIIQNNSLILNRPIQIVGNKSYSASRISFKDSKGKVSECWVVTSGDFEERYSEVPLSGHRIFSESPFSIDLAGIPRPGSTLSPAAYQKYVLDGTAPPPIARLFVYASAAISSFVAFDGSFADQADMSDFLACWAISTYATSAFDTMGYIWPNGERGSGKTQLLKAVMNLSFMGLTVASSSSFASFRDQAALGATIGLDDCEEVRRMENSKRELLLAGNTKGAGFMFKEPGKREGSWTTRYIDAFAPRGFTSIGLPDPVLASRVILIPLVASGDLTKTRKKPTNHADWNVPPHDIRDGIWLSVCKELLSIRKAKADVDSSSEISGRDYDIFQAPLTIAYWLDRTHNMDGLFDRMLGVMSAYHEVKQQNNLPSFELLLLQALIDLLSKAGAVTDSISTADIMFRVQEICHERDITDEELLSSDVQKIGMALGRLGFVKSKSHGRQRKWQITKSVVLQKAKAAGFTLELPDPVESPPIEIAILPESDRPMGWGHLGPRIPWNPDGESDDSNQPATSTKRAPW